MRAAGTGPQCGLLAGAVLASCLAHASSGAHTRSCVAESNFQGGDDSWTVKGAQAEVYTPSGPLATTFAVKGGGKEWWFVAPPAFLGDKVDAYRGLLEFRLGHAHHIGHELDRSKVWGVRIEGRGMAIAALAHIGRNFLNLSESGVWTVDKGKGAGHAPTQLQFLGLLSEITAIRIRGNYFQKAEITWIDDVAIVKGDEDVQKMRSRVQKSALAYVLNKKGAGQPVQLVGVGMVLTKHFNSTLASKGAFKIKRLQPGSPALWSSIRVGDILMRVGDQITQDMSLQQLAQLLRGEVGSTVRLKLFSIHRDTTYEQMLERVPLEEQPPAPKPPAPPPISDRDPAAAAANNASRDSEFRRSEEARKRELEKLKRQTREQELQVLAKKKQRWEDIKRAEAGGRAIGSKKAGEHDLERALETDQCALEEDTTAWLSISERGDDIVAERNVEAAADGFRYHASNVGAAMGHEATMSTGADTTQLKTDAVRAALMEGAIAGEGDRPDPYNKDNTSIERGHEEALSPPVTSGADDHQPDVLGRPTADSTTGLGNNAAQVKADDADGNAVSTGPDAINAEDLAGSFATEQLGKEEMLGEHTNTASRREHSARKGFLSRFGFGRFSK